MSVLDSFFGGVTSAVTGLASVTGTVLDGAGNVLTDVIAIDQKIDQISDGNRTITEKTETITTAPTNDGGVKDKVEGLNNRIVLGVGALVVVALLAGR